MDKTSIIEKVRFLLNLASTESTPINEAEAAKNAANKLIEKFQLTEEDYQVVEVKPIYSDDELLFETKELQDHLAQLALTCAEKFDCFVIQERNVAQDGDTSYRYFIYGDSTDIIRVKALFSFVKKEVDSIISMFTRGRGKLYIDSFAEGVVNGVRINIKQEDFHVEGLVIQSKEEKISEGAIIPTESPKKEPPPIEEKTDLGSGKDSKPIDAIAFFYGEEKGRAIHIGKIMDDFMLEEDESEILIDLFEKVKGVLKNE